MRRALVACAALLAVGILGTLAPAAQRISGSNRVPNPEFATQVQPGTSVCQGNELVPADTAALRMTIASYRLRTPPVSYTLTDAAGRAIAAGALAGGFREGVVDLPLARVVRRTQGPARFCLQNAGMVRITVAGVSPYGGTGSRLEYSDGSSKPGALRIDYLRPGRESWLSLLGTLTHRMTIGKGSLVREWAWAGALLMMLALAALCARALLAEAR